MTSGPHLSVRERTDGKGGWAELLGWLARWPEQVDRSGLWAENEGKTKGRFGLDKSGGKVLAQRKRKIERERERRNVCSKSNKHISALQFDPIFNFSSYA